MAVAAAVLAVASPGWADSKNMNPGVIPPNASAYGKTYAEWGAKWWEWVLAIPWGDSPLADDDGSSCGVGQSGQVWFLAGSWVGAVTRTCTVPAGKAVFFPILNVLYSPIVGDPDDEATLMDLATAYFTDENAATLVCEVDGVRLQNLDRYLVGAFRFDLSIPPGGLLGNDEVVTGYGVVNGFYIMLAPLSVGTHTIHFYGLAAQHPDVEQNVTYELDVK
ncbi:MAG: hypothetical protein HY718_20615 [Planctomycetes bacterium]|nr:hypothetical protein [Planctomycetota bacterium]